MLYIYHSYKTNTNTNACVLLSCVSQYFTTHPQNLSGM